ncbi:hypothetical protein OWM54_20440 [Myxococcus sp. MISCRS1]|uniref:hypothetical protein n=1 Tax=Myxococcus TaxID=32 RepID=UPI001CBB5CA4|nr:MULTISPECIES: hypothetical protein [unclassified Myxococcus]MBZ4399012.1 hypothetical protein [Myxococcus sp. AS-1-15]MCY0999506.1 hypothetical protein [Myxococcus sp. MISCRS1]
MNCGAPFLKSVERESTCGHCGADRPRPSNNPLPLGWKEVPAPRSSNDTKVIVAWGLLGIGLTGGLLAATLMLALSPHDEPPPRVVTPRPVSPPPPPIVTPPPPPPPIVEAPPPVPEIIVEKPVKRPPPPMPRTNEAWGALQLAKKLRQYDYCGKEAILRDGTIPRRFTLHARFDANGEGMRGHVLPKTSVRMLDACIKNRTKYVYLGTPPEKREFEVEVTLSFAHLRPKGKPETYDDQWSVLYDD